MSDNTAIPVSPGHEEEAMKLSQMFSRAAEAIVASSTLPRQVEDLKNQVRHLEWVVADAQTHSHELDCQLSEMRQERDDYKVQVGELEETLAYTNTDATNLHTDLDKAKSEIDTLDTILVGIRNERDDYGMKNMELEDQLKAANDKLDKIKEDLGVSQPTVVELPPFINPVKVEPVDPVEDNRPWWQREQEDIAKAY